MCKSRQQAQAALARLRELLADLGLAPKEAETRSSNWQWAQKVSTFLAPTTRWCARGAPTAGAGWCSWHAGPVIGGDDNVHATGITELTVRSRLRLPVEEVAEDLNRFLRGRPEPFPLRQLRGPLPQDRAARTPSARSVHRQAAQTRTWLRLVRPRLQVDRPVRIAQPWMEPVLHPGPTSPGGRNRMPGGNHVGKPCAGEPHARFLCGCGSWKRNNDRARATK